MSDPGPNDWLLEPVGMDDLDAASRSAALHLLSDHVWKYYRRFGRSFPWRETSDPYRVVLSELMLQQTQTDRVLPKYRMFVQRWPGFQEMAASQLLEVLSAWKGLGYNRRALALRGIAVKSAGYGWTLPDDYHALLTFPMIGPATASAVLSFCFGKPSIYLETNIRRVLIHQFFPGERQVADSELRTLLGELADMQTDCKHWYYALMDYGVFLRKAVVNPNRRSAHYTRQERFENSNRQIRGMLLMVFTEEGPRTLRQLCSRLPFERDRIGQCLEALMAEGFVDRLDSRCPEDEENVSEEGPRYGIPSGRQADLVVLPGAPANPQ